MTSMVPATVTWPVIVFMACVVCARFRWCNLNLYDAYSNNTLLLILMALLLHDHSLESLLSRTTLMAPATAQQLAVVATILAAAEFGGFVVCQSGLSLDETRRRHWYYRLLAAILCATFLAAATPARVAGRTLETAGGWDGVMAWALYLTMLLVISAQIISMSVSELRKHSSRRELIVGFALLLLGISIGTVSLEALSLAVTDQLGWTTTANFRQWFDGVEFVFESFFLCVIAAVPLVVNLLSYFGLDSTTRLWHKLQPLRQSIVNVVPAGILDTQHDDRSFRKTTLELHQTIIEIREAMMRLRPYFSDRPVDDMVCFFEAHSVPAHERDYAMHAVYLAHAAKAKNAGTAPEPLGAAPILRSGSPTLDAEASELSKLAKWWQAACATTAH